MWDIINIIDVSAYAVVVLIAVITPVRRVTTSDQGQNWRTFFLFLHFVIIIIIIIDIFKKIIIMIVIFDIIIRPAEYKLPVIREICICMFSLYIKMKFEKKLLFFLVSSSTFYLSLFQLLLALLHIFGPFCLRQPLSLNTREFC